MKFRRKIFIYNCFIIIALVSCNKHKKDINIKKQAEINSYIIDTISKDSVTPIFLNLSPKMSVGNFNRKLKKSLPKQTFTIPIDGKNLNFILSKTNNKITLNYSNIDTIKFRDKFGNDAEERYNKFIAPDSHSEQSENMIKEFKEIFEKKYINRINNLPLLKNQDGDYFTTPFRLRSYKNSNKSDRYRKERNLFDYGFYKENYLIFQDSIKTTIIGFSNSQLSRSPYIDKKTIEKNKLAIKNSRLARKLKELNKNQTPYQSVINSIGFEKEIIKIRGYELEINFMHNSDFDSLTQLIHENDIWLNKQKRKEDSLKNVQEKILDKNIQAL